MKPKISQTILNESGIGVVRSTPAHQAGGEGSIPIIPHLVRASGPSKNLCDKITNDWHSYVKATERGGRAIDYLIYGRSSESVGAEADSLGELVGTIGFAFLGLRIPTPLAKAFSMGQVRREDTNSMIKARRVCACFRYTLMSHVPKNFASQALGASLVQLRNDWHLKYEDCDSCVFDKRKGIYTQHKRRLLGVATFVKPPWTGACFKAANFRLVGYTSGHPITYSLSHHREGILQDEKLYILVFRYGGWPKVTEPEVPSVRKASKQVYMD